MQYYDETILYRTAQDSKTKETESTTRYRRKRKDAVVEKTKIPSANAARQTGLVILRDRSDLLLFNVHYASNVSPQTLPRQLTQPRRPYGTRKILLSAASFPT